MAKPAGKKVDIEKIAEKYLSRMKGQPDSLRLLMNLLADNLTNLDALKEQIIKHEFALYAAKSKEDRAALVQRLAETYGMSKSRVLEIVK